MLALTPFTEADIDRLIEWLPTPEDLLLWTATSFSFPLTREQVQAHLADSAARGDRRIYKVVRVETGMSCGHIELGAIDRAHRSLRIGRVLLAPEMRGTGAAVEMMRLALRIAFEELHMHRVELGVFHVNRRAIALYEKVGFHGEGVRRDSFLAPEGYWSEVVMSLLGAEWAALSV
ncbi:MAG TPA: GNAT family N-acetyltransferase [Acidobacteria bacterium]|nr:GNAT family N-acetyltransferase [Acidobacteriota bacterium]